MTNLNKRASSVSSSLRYVVMFVVAMVHCGCLSTHVEGDIIYTESVDPELWRREQIVSFEFTPTDTLSLNDMSIFLRYQPQAKMGSTSLLIYVSDPDHTLYMDELNIPLNDDASPRGWRGIPQLREQLYRQDIVWQKGGSYRVHISPSEPIVGIEAVGIRIGNKQHGKR